VKIRGTAQNDPTKSFSATYELQRPGLLLMDGVVYAAFGGHCDTGSLLRLGGRGVDLGSAEGPLGCSRQRFGRRHMAVWRWDSLGRARPHTARDREPGSARPAHPGQHPAPGLGPVHGPAAGAGRRDAQGQRLLRAL
jgi:hypothetical protein